MDCIGKHAETAPDRREIARLILESTLKIAAYPLTPQDFPNYSVSMDAELAALEAKILQAAQLCQQLRDENRNLRQQLVAAQGDKKQLSEKIDHARDRLESLLKRIPDQASAE